MTARIKPSSLHCPACGTELTVSAHATSPVAHDPLLTIAEVAAQVGRTVPTVQWWRKTSSGPRMFKLGGRVVCRQSDLDAWIKSQEEQSVRGGRQPRVESS
jgi:predicted DNA-binding transcriptional regulator AlpA